MGQVSKENIVLRYRENGRVTKAEFSTYAALGKWVCSCQEGKIIISVDNERKY